MSSQQIPDILAETYSPSQFIPTKSVGYLVKLLHFSIQKAIEAEMVALDLTALQWKPLLTLAKTEHPCTISEMAQHLALDTPCTTRLVDRLVQKGFVLRQRSETDRRIVYLTLTESGQQTSQQIPAKIADALKGHLTGILPEELESFKALALRMLNNASPDLLEDTPLQ